MSKLSDFQPPLIIDIGSDKIKFCQPNLNTLFISNVIRKEKKKEKEEVKINIDENKSINNYISETNNKLHPTLQDEIDHVNVNPNSIFDLNLFMDSFPSLLSRLDPKCEPEEIFKLKRLFNKNDFQQIFKQPEFEVYKDKKINFSFDFHNTKFDSNSNKFGYEPIWEGILDDKENISNILKKVGEIKYGKYNFLNNLYRETPLVITQNALPFDALKTQIKKIYEIAFEELKAPYVLICSQAMLNLFSHNLSSGVVVDMGESGTHITSIKDGFTENNNTISSSFLSGRTLTCLIATFLKLNKNKKILTDNYKEENPSSQNDMKGLKRNFQNSLKLNFIPKNEIFEISYEEYLEAKFLKESKNICYDPKMANNIVNENYLDYNNINIQDMSTFNYLYSFPEIYKWLFNKNNYQKDFTDYNTFYNNLNSTVKFILENKEIKLFNERDKFNNFNIEEFNKSFISPYLTQNFNSVEKDILLMENNFLYKEELNKFRQLGLSHMIISQLEKIISQDVLSGGKYMNIVLSGGVLNTPNLPQIINQDFNSLLKLNGGDTNSVELKFMQNFDNSLNFYKGANYLSKIDGLENIMIRRQDYYDYGGDYLCYNYI